MLKVVDGGTPPKIKTKYSSSADLCSSVDVVIRAGETKIIPLGVKIDLDEIKSILAKHKYFLEDFLKSHFMELKLRSSLGEKGLILPNGVGEIDIDYTDEIMIAIHNPITIGLPVKVVRKFNNNHYSKIIESEHIHYLAGEVKIKAGESIAQIKLMEHKNYLMPDRFRNEDQTI